MKHKYPHLVALSRAFATGELDPTCYVLVVDNDDSFLRYCGPLLPGLKPDSHAADVWLEEKSEECRGWYRGNGEGDMLDALKAAGIPAECC